MVEFSYLYKGLCGMARAHLANLMTGHLGAAVVAGYFCGEDMPHLDDTVYRAIEGELDRVIRGDEKWFEAEKVGLTATDLFKPFPDESTQADQIETIPRALANNIDTMRESGHNIIFTSIAVRALLDHGRFATPSIVHGIQQLIAGFDNSGQGRGNYGKQRGWILGKDLVLAEDNDFPPYRDQAEMVNVVMDELIETASVQRQGWGGLWHVINHAAAIIELARFGFADLAERGLASHHYHIRLWRSLPNLETELGPVQCAQHDPRTPQFWKNEEIKRDSARLTHRIKTLYGFYTIARLVSDQAKLALAEEKLRYLM